MPYSIYIYRHGHRFNLYSFHTIQNNYVVVDFFDTVIYENSKRQKTKRNTLTERLVETRWSYWHPYLKKKKIQMRYNKFKVVLKIFTVQDDQSARVIGLLEEISTFRFI